MVSIFSVHFFIRQNLTRNCFSRFFFLMLYFLFRSLFLLYHSYLLFFRSSFPVRVCGCSTCVCVRSRRKLFLRRCAAKSMVSGGLWLLSLKWALMPLRPIFQVRVVNLCIFLICNSIYCLLSVNKIDSMGLLSFWFVWFDDWFILFFSFTAPEDFWILTTISGAMVGLALITFTLTNPHYSR